MWGSTDEDRVCVFCHTPHNANPNVRPLWNRDVPTDTYKLYDTTVSATLNATVNQPQGDSLLCLSCHDGVIAINALLNGGTPTMPALGDQLGDVYYPGSPYGMAKNIGGNYPANPTVNDLSNDHPVSFTFDAALVGADGALQLPPGGDPVRLRGVTGDQVECTSCHNPHDNQYGGFLVTPNTQSAMCLTCHLK